MSGDSYPAHLQLIPEAGQGSQQLRCQKRVSLTEEAKGGKPTLFQQKAMRLVGNGLGKLTALLSQFRIQEQKADGKNRKTNIKTVELILNI